ncbi:hypothetical protein [uncultured Rikenella sp.]|uniref:hypothetical protein n=1 Tax=uncultured Rikenella sp. TaxID=368003 RepID=UPI00272CC466|nr:hypothetical protein [uncultured Rikenella sp.]
MISYFSDRARKSFVPPETALRGRRPGDPGGTERYCVSLNQLSPVFGARRGNPVKTCQHIWAISLLRRRRAIWSLPRLELFFLTSLSSFSSSPLGNLQTAFALPSLVASVVNKENLKNF